MTCPICSGKTKVIDTAHDFDAIYRRRECLDCKFRFSTVEVDEDMFYRLEKKKK